MLPVRDISVTVSYNKHSIAIGDGGGILVLSTGVHPFRKKLERYPAQISDYGFVRFVLVRGKILLFYFSFLCTYTP